MAYNRFRYYDRESGNYLSQDPIGIEGNNPTVYGYVHDTNGWIDSLGLQNGGGYGPVRGSNVGGETNHIPAWNSIELAQLGNPSLTNLPTYSTTPTVHMDRPDHKGVTSTGSLTQARRWRRNQADLIQRGKFGKAMEMDIREITRKYGNKYDAHIHEMLHYARSRGWLHNAESNRLKRKYTNY